MTRVVMAEAVVGTGYYAPHANKLWVSRVLLKFGLLPVDVMEKQ